MRRFFDDYGSCFVKDKTVGAYLMSKNISRGVLRKYFSSIISEWLKKNTRKFSITKPEYFFVVNNCKPRDNILLKIRDEEEYFPRKLDIVLGGEHSIEFGLKESDIRIDTIAFNTLFSSIFSGCFESRKRLDGLVGCERRNVFFIQHRRLDYVTFKKIFRHMFGRKNVEKVQIDPSSEVLVNMNILLNKYIRNKSKLNSDAEFIQCFNEVKEFIVSLLGEFSNGKE